MCEIETYDVTCGNTCGHFDSLNECCWLSWWHKNEGDFCNYGFRVTEDNTLLTPKELEELSARVREERLRNE